MRTIMRTIMRSTLKCLLFLLLALSPAFPQSGGCLMRQVIYPPQPTGLGQPAPGTAVYVCTNSACSSLVSLFSDPSLSQSVSNPMTTDANGNYYACAAPGSYFVREVLPVGGTVYNYYVTTSPGSTVSSVFGREGNVVAQTGDYNYNQITGVVGLSAALASGSDAGAKISNACAGSTTVWVPASMAGSYTTTISITGACHIIVDGATTLTYTGTGYALSCSGAKGVLIEGSGRNGDGSTYSGSTLNVTNTAGGGVSAVNCPGFTMKNFNIMGPGSGTGKGIYNASTRAHYYDINVNSFGSDGVTIDGSTYNANQGEYDKVRSSYNGGNGFTIEGVNGQLTMLQSSDAAFNTGDGFAVSNQINFFNGTNCSPNTGEICYHFLSGAGYNRGTIFADAPSPQVTFDSGASYNYLTALQNVTITDNGSYNSIDQPALTQSSSSARTYESSSANDIFTRWTIDSTANREVFLYGSGGNDIWRIEAPSNSVNNYDYLLRDVADSQRIRFRVDPAASGGVTEINSTSTGTVQINTRSGSSTAGTQFGDGAGNVVASVSGAGAVTAKSTNGVINAAQQSGSDIGAKINSAITALGSAGGHIKIPCGTYSYSTQIVADSTYGMWVEGDGGVSPGHGVCVQLTWSGTTNPITAQSSNGFRWSNVQLFWSSASFSGNVINLSSSQGAEIDHDFFGRSGSGVAAACILNLDNSIITNIHDNTFSKYQSAICGASTTGHYANVVKIDHNDFSSSTGTCNGQHILNPASGWTISNNDFEQGQGDGTCAITAYANSFTTSQGIDIFGNWIGDNGASAYTLFNMNGSGWNIHGNFIAGNASSTGFAVQNSTTGISISGNRIQTLSIGYNIGSSVTINTKGNAYSSITTCFTGVAQTPDVTDCLGLPSNGTIYVTSPVTTTFTSANITGLAWTVPANTATNIPFSCSIIYSQATGTASVSFGLLAGSAPTYQSYNASMQTSATAQTSSAGSAAGVTSLGLVAATPSATSTTYGVVIKGLIEQASGTSNTYQLTIGTANSSDAVTVQRDSYCTLF